MVSHSKATVSTENNALEAAKALSDTIQFTPEWSELVDVQQAIDRDRETISEGLGLISPAASRSGGIGAVAKKNSSVISNKTSNVL